MCLFGMKFDWGWLFFSLFCFFIFRGGCCMACRIFVLQPGIKPWLMAVNHWVLTTGMWGNSQSLIIFESRQTQEESLTFLLTAYRMWIENLFTIAMIWTRCVDRNLANLLEFSLCTISLPGSANICSPNTWFSISMWIAFLFFEVPNHDPSIFICL